MKDYRGCRYPEMNELYCDVSEQVSLPTVHVKVPVGDTFVPFNTGFVKENITSEEQLEEICKNNIDKYLEYVENKNK